MRTKLQAALVMGASILLGVALLGIGPTKASADSTYPGGCRTSWSGNTGACISEAFNYDLSVDGYANYEPSPCYWDLALVVKVGSFGQTIDDSGWQSCAGTHDQFWVDPSVYRSCGICGPGAIFYTFFQVADGNSYSDYINSPLIRP